MRELARNHVHGDGAVKDRGGDDVFKHSRLRSPDPSLRGLASERLVLRSAPCGALTNRPQAVRHADHAKNGGKARLPNLTNRELRALSTPDHSSPRLVARQRGSITRPRAASCAGETPCERYRAGWSSGLLRRIHAATKQKPGTRSHGIYCGLAGRLTCARSWARASR